MALSRRAILATPALLAGHRAARAEPAVATAQAPGFYRLKLGEYTLTVINDGTGRLANPTGGFVRNATAEAVRAALADDFLPTDHFVMTFNLTVLQTGRETVLFDAGTGGLLAPTAGHMWENLAAAGIDPAGIDRVIFTHLHADHVSGLVTREGEARFARAELIVPAPEWAFWTGEQAPAQARAMVAGRFAPYRGRTRQVAPDAELGSGIRAIPTHGHTQGHCSYEIQSGAASLIVMGDLTNAPVFNLNHPGWHIAYDMDGPEAEATRRAFFDRAAADRTPIIGYHWPFPAVGRVRKQRDGYTLVPIPWSVGL